jgi:hypothetical protein
MAFYATFSADPQIPHLMKIRRVIGDETYGQTDLLIMR